MNLLDALTVTNKVPRKDASLRRLFLAVGFEALHLETFLVAELSLALPHDRRIEIEKGLYGDLFGSLGRGQLGGWGPRELSDIVA